MCRPSANVHAAALGLPMTCLKAARTAAKVQTVTAQASAIESSIPPATKPQVNGGRIHRPQSQKATAGWGTLHGTWDPRFGAGDKYYVQKRAMRNVVPKVSLNAPPVTDDIITFSPQKLLGQGYNPAQQQRTSQHLSHEKDFYRDSTGHLSITERLDEIAKSVGGSRKVRPATKQHNSALDDGSSKAEEKYRHQTVHRDGPHGGLLDAMDQATMDVGCVWDCVVGRGPSSLLDAIDKLEMSGRTLLNSVLSTLESNKIMNHLKAAAAKMNAAVALVGRAILRLKEEPKCDEAPQMLEEVYGAVDELVLLCDSVCQWATKAGYDEMSAAGQLISDLITCVGGLKAKSAGARSKGALGPILGEILVIVASSSDEDKDKMLVADISTAYDSLQEVADAVCTEMKTVGCRTPEDQSAEDQSLRALDDKLKESVGWFCGSISECRTNAIDFLNLKECDDPCLPRALIRDSAITVSSGNNLLGEMTPQDAAAAELLRSFDQLNNHLAVASRAEHDWLDSTEVPLADDKPIMERCQSYLLRVAIDKLLVGFTTTWDRAVRSMRVLEDSSENMSAAGVITTKDRAYRHFDVLTDSSDKKSAAQFSTTWDRLARAIHVLGGSSEMSAVGCDTAWDRVVNTVCVLEKSSEISAVGFNTAWDRAYRNFGVLNNSSEMPAVECDTAWDRVARTMDVLDDLSEMSAAQFNSAWDRVVRNFDVLDDSTDLSELAVAVEQMGFLIDTVRENLFSVLDAQLDGSDLFGRMAPESVAQIKLQIEDLAKVNTKLADKLVRALAGTAVLYGSHDQRKEDELFGDLLDSMGEASSAVGMVAKCIEFGVQTARRHSGMRGNVNSTHPRAAITSTYEDSDDLVVYYEIEVTHGAASWKVPRRYAEFDSLREQLENDGITVTDFPRKHMFRSNTDAVIMDRQIELTEFIKHTVLRNEQHDRCRAFLELDEHTPTTIDGPSSPLSSADTPEGSSSWQATSADKCGTQYVLAPSEGKIDALQMAFESLNSSMLTVQDSVVRAISRNPDRQSSSKLDFSKLDQSLKTVSRSVKSAGIQILGLWRAQKAQPHVSEPQPRPQVHNPVTQLSSPSGVNDEGFTFVAELITNPITPRSLRQPTNKPVSAIQEQYANSRWFTNSPSDAHPSSR